VRLLQAFEFSKKLPWLAQARVITLKTAGSKRKLKTTVATQL